MAYSATLTATGGQTPCSWSITTGALCRGHPHEGNNQLIFSGLGLPLSSSVTVVARSGYALEQQDTNVNGSRAASEDAEVAATGSFSGAFTLNSSAEWSCVVATFK